MHPLVDRDLNVVRPNSKSSGHGSKASDTNSPGHANPDAVASMLRNTTETGDLGVLASGASRFPRLPNAFVRRPNKLPGGLAASTSRASSHYSKAGSHHGSVRSAKSQRSNQDAASDAGMPYGHRRFAASQEYHHPVTDGGLYYGMDNGRSHTMTTTGYLEHGDRAYSLTQDFPPSRQMADNRSISSLRSHGWTGRPRSPYLATQRFNPGFRPASPALSDTAGVIGPSRAHARPHPYRLYAGTPPPARYSPDIPLSAAMSRQPFKPSRAFDDLRRPFMQTIQPSARQYEAPEQFRRPQPPPFREHDYGAPFPHITGPPPANAGSSSGAVLFRTTTPPFVNQSGIVQRVRNVLEERSSTEDFRSGSPRFDAGSPNLFVTNPSNRQSENFNPSDNDSSPPLAQSAKDGLPMDDILSSSPTVKRLTRDLIKAGVDGMSDIAEMSDVGDTRAQWDPVETADTSEIPGAFPADVPVDNGEVEEQMDDGDDEVPANPVSFNFRMSMLRDNADQPQHKQEDPAVDLSEQGPAVNLSEQGPAVNLSEQSSPLPSSSSTHAFEVDQPRPSSMPHQYSPRQSKNSRNSTKSLPVFAQDQQLAADTNWDEQQKAIRLSKIWPKHTSQMSEGSPTVIGSHPEDNVSSDRLSRSSTTRVSNIEVHPPVTVTTPAVTNTSIAQPAPNSARNSIRNSILESGRLIPSASRSGALSADQRASAIKNYQLPLPDLTEDSQEDASTTNLRMLGMRAPSFRPRQFRDFRTSSRLSTDPAGPPAQPQPTYLGTTLQDTRNIPSFNFSRVDLTSKLNRALGYRLSRTFEDFTQSTGPLEESSAEDGQRSSVAPRERYRSFFVFDETSDELPMEQPPEVTPQEVTKAIPIDQDILNEIDRLSIPSVKHLTTRLSELLPDIKQSQTESDLDKIDKALKDTLKELRQMGAAEKNADVDAGEGPSKSSGATSRVNTIRSNASGRYRVKNRDRPLMQLMKELPPLPAEEEGSEDSSGNASAETAPEHIESVAADECNDTVGRHEESDPEGTVVDNTVSTILHDLSKKVVQQPQQTKPTEQASMRAESTPRPWNKQESYPWSDNTPSIKLVPAEEPDDAIRPIQPARLRPSRGDEDGKAVHIVRSMSPGFKDSNLVPIAKKEKHDTNTKKGLLQSLGKMVGLKHKISTTGPTIDPRFLHPEDDHSQTHSQVSERRVDRGDRYPTTSLIAPEGMQMDGVTAVNDGARSFFSNDSSISDRATFGLRKRLTRFRAGRQHADHDQNSFTRSANASRTEVQPQVQSFDYPATQTTGIHQPSYHQPLEPAPPGMSKTEFRAKRLVEKLRFLIFKSGERLKTLAGQKKRERPWYEGGPSDEMLYGRQ